MQDFYIFTKIQKIASLATFQRKLPHCCTHAAFVWNRRGYIICQLRFDQRLKRWLISGVFFPAFRCTTCLCTWIFLAAVRHCRDWSAPNDVLRAPAVLLSSKGWVACQGEGLWAVLHRCIRAQQLHHEWWNGKRVRVRVLEHVVHRNTSFFQVIPLDFFKKATKWQQQLLQRSKLRAWML